MKEHLVYLKNFVFSFVTQTIELFSSLTFKRFQNFGYDFMSKLKNFKETNWDLALYHFNLGNTNDAIMRFKLVQKAGYKVPSCHYFLGRLYQNKNKLLEAKQYFELYLASKEQDHLDETNYFLALISEKEISEIPLSLLIEKRELLAAKLNKEALDDENLSKIFALVTLCKNTAIQSQKVLELGSQFGLLGKLLRANITINYLKGKEFGEELIEFTRQVKDDNKQLVYDSLVTVENLTTFFEEKNLYNLVVMQNFMDDYADVSNILMKVQSLIDLGGHLLLAFRQDDSPFYYSHFLNDKDEILPITIADNIVVSDKTFTFIKELEVFSFNPYYVKSLAEKMGFTVKISLQINHFTLILLNKC